MNDESRPVRHAVAGVTPGFRRGRVATPRATAIAAVLAMGFAGGGCAGSSDSSKSADGGAREPTTSTAATRLENEDETAAFVQILVPDPARAGKYLDKGMQQVSKNARACVAAAVNTAAERACETPEALRSYLTADQLAFKSVSESLTAQLAKRFRETDEYAAWYQCVEKLEPQPAGLNKENAEQLINEALAAGTLQEAALNGCFDAAYGGIDGLLRRQRTLGAELATLPEAKEMVRLAGLVGF